jgi:hypothetical protein
MKKIPGSKTAILILGGLSTLVIVYLIASMGNLELKAAIPFAVVQEPNTLSPVGQPTWNGIGYLFVFFLTLVVILYFFLPANQRKKYLRGLAWLVFTGILFQLVFSQVRLGKSIVLEQETFYGMPVTKASGSTEMLIPRVTPSVFAPPQISSWVSYLVALVLLLIVAGGWSWLVWRRRKNGMPYDALAEIARSALDDIQAGRDWGDTILNSYQQMNKTVADWRGIHRLVGMTPAEFAAFLVSAHLPGEAVNRLTVLFEDARYGDKKSTPEDIQDAVDSLTAILEYCRVAK